MPSNDTEQPTPLNHAEAGVTLFPDLPSPATPQTVILLESLLFVVGEPVTIEQLAKALEITPSAASAALSELRRQCAQRGVRIQEIDGRVQLVSAPEAAPAIGRLLGAQAANRLSNAALEVLAIVAYRQPITRAQIDAIRGVDSSGVVRALLARDLIGEVGRLETLGRPIVYGTTPLFLQQFGLTALAELPEIDLPEQPDLTPEET